MHNISWRSKLNNGSSWAFQMVITFNSEVRLRRIIYLDARNWTMEALEQFIWSLFSIWSNLSWSASSRCFINLSKCYIKACIWNCKSPTPSLGLVPDILNKQIKRNKTIIVVVWIPHPLKCITQLWLFSNETLLPFTTLIPFEFLGNSRDYGHNKEQFTNMCKVRLERQGKG